MRGQALRDSDISMERRDFLKQSAVSGKLPADTDKETLFKQYKAWEADQNARAQAQAPAPRSR